jgi:hypothetical protein
LKRPKLALALAFVFGVLVGLALMWPIKTISVKVALPPPTETRR